MGEYDCFWSILFSRPIRFIITLPFFQLSTILFYLFFYCAFFLQSGSSFLRTECASLFLSWGSFFYSPQFSFFAHFSCFTHPILPFLTSSHPHHLSCHSSALLNTHLHPFPLLSTPFHHFPLHAKTSEQ